MAASALEFWRAVVLDHAPPHLVRLGLLVIVKPETVVGWHQTSFWLYWRWWSRARGGWPRISQEVGGVGRTPGEGECRLGRSRAAWRTCLADEDGDRSAGTNVYYRVVSLAAPSSAEKLKKASPQRGFF